MDAWVWILIVVAAVVVIALIAAASLRQRRTTALRQHFGSEYDRTVQSRDDRRSAEADLRSREKQRAQLDIKPLPEASRGRLSDEWRAVQEQFVDQPSNAVMAADSLLTRVMSARGYPMDNFDVQADLVSVDHPQVVENYRYAHGVCDRAQTQRASTEDLRQALVCYRSLFDELLQTDAAERNGGADRNNEGRHAADQDEPGYRDHPIGGGTR
jgi:hypothetical protein